jgi:glycosyltransferase involved in cell wall biosynthesis
MSKDKKRILYVSPLLSRSGYGDHAREIASVLYNKFSSHELKFAITPWGSNPQTGLNKELSEKYKPHFVNEKDHYTGCDVYIQLGLPNEFKKVGSDTNIGITAGVEVDYVPSSMLNGLNQMDHVIVPSNFTKETFENSYKENEIDKTTEISVIAESSSFDFYQDSDSSSSINELNEIKEDFCFLSVGQWITSESDDGGRKNIESLIESFIKAFNNTDDKPALVLKTSGSNFSISDYFEISNKIKSIIEEHPSQSRPSIYLLHGDISESEIHSVYTHPKIKAFISHTKGEGFGRPILEATLCGLPVLATKWSGHLDIIDKKNSILLPGKLTNITKETSLFSTKAKWMVVDKEVSSQKIKDVYQNYDKYNTKALKLKEINKSKFDINKISSLYESLFNQYI